MRRDQLRDVDVALVWKLDRLSRSLKDLLHLLEKVQAAGAGLLSLTEAIDTTTSAGRMMIRERTGAGWRRRAPSAVSAGAARS